jgi:oligopeptidase B
MKYCHEQVQHGPGSCFRMLVSGSTLCDYFSYLINYQEPEADMPSNQKSPPVAEKRPQTTVRHGTSITDDYAWLKDENWQDVMRDPAMLADDIRAYLEAENAYAKTTMAPLEPLKETLFQEMKGRIKADDRTVPLIDGPFAYFRKYVEGGQHPHYCRVAQSTSTEEVLLDGDNEAEGLAYFKLAAITHSPDHKFLAYSNDTNGSEIYTLRFRNLGTGQDLTDVVDGVSGSVEWTNDSLAVLYTVLDDNHRPCAVRRHQLGTAPEDDIEIYREQDTGFFVSIDKTESRKFLIINAHDHQTSEIHLVDADAQVSLPVLVQRREVELEYEAAHHNEQLFILTNADGAEDFKVVSVPVDAPARENWRDLVPHQPGTLILGIQVFADHWVRIERFEGLPRIIVTSFRTGDCHEISFDEEAYSLSVGGSYEFKTNTLRFTYSSMATPERVYDYDMQSRQRVLRKEQQVPSGHDPDAYVSCRLMAPAEDGETVPISLLYHKDTPLDGSAPVLLYGYGSYGHAIPAAFGTARLSLVDRGVVYAIAHIRGGMEKGYGWYKAGKREFKKNTFTDFIAAGEFLVREGFTAKGMIAAHGGSAGGMLVGAVVNMRPDLFGAIVAEVPFVDVLNTMCDETLPLTPPEWPEWGNPLESREAFDYIRSYSPYDQVTAKNYPPLFVTAGLTDPRVTYWEPAKWVAKLRAMKTDVNPVLFKTNMDAGHGGAAGRFDRLQETALAYAFVLNVFGKQ